MKSQVWCTTHAFHTHQSSNYSKNVKCFSVYHFRFFHTAVARNGWNVKSWSLANLSRWGGISRLLDAPCQLLLDLNQDISQTSQIQFSSQTNLSFPSKTKETKFFLLSVCYQFIALHVTWWPNPETWGHSDSPSPSTFLPNSPGSPVFPTPRKDLKLAHTATHAQCHCLSCSFIFSPLN